jgi:hypothetical protein
MLAVIVKVAVVSKMPTQGEGRQKRKEREKEKGTKRRERTGTTVLWD